MSFSLNDLKKILSYDSETGVFKWTGKEWGKVKDGAVAGSFRTDGYARIGIMGKSFFTHRLAWFFVKGSWPINQIDHINGDKSDNRICNLREVSPSINRQNMRKASLNNKSGLLGAHWHKRDKCWRATIVTGGKVKHLGSYKNAEAAHFAYLVAKRELHAGCTI